MNSHKNFADKVIDFHKQMDFSIKLPKDIRVLDPLKESREVELITEKFYKKFYNDNRQRKLILGINPGRLGAGTTGIPFTDTKRLSQVCKIEIEGIQTHEPSSVFIYDVIESYGGAEKFYNDFYINSMSPLGFIKLNSKNNWINYNYYDSDELFHAVKPFIVASLKEQINFGIDKDICFIIGKKNLQYFNRINKEEKLFDKVVVLDHPRYIVQYKSSKREDYIAEYIQKLSM